MVGAPGSESYLPHDSGKEDTRGSRALISSSRRCSYMTGKLPTRVCPLNVLSPPIGSWTEEQASDARTFGKHLANP